jgi:hypothetical protein
MPETPRGWLSWAAAVTDNYHRPFISKYHRRPLVDCWRSIFSFVSFLQVYLMRFGLNIFGRDIEPHAIMALFSVPIPSPANNRIASERKAIVWDVCFLNLCPEGPRVLSAQISHSLSLDLHTHGLIIVGIGILKDEECDFLLVFPILFPRTTNPPEGSLVIGLPNYFEVETSISSDEVCRLWQGGLLRSDGFFRRGGAFEKPREQAHDSLHWRMPLDWWGTSAGRPV